MSTWETQYIMECEKKAVQSKTWRIRLLSAQLSLVEFGYKMNCAILIQRARFQWGIYELAYQTCVFLCILAVQQYLCGFQKWWVRYRAAMTWLNSILVTVHTKGILYGNITKIVYCQSIGCPFLCAICYFHVKRILTAVQYYFPIAHFKNYIRNIGQVCSAFFLLL